MIVTTSEKIEDKKIIKTIGYVKGSSARARNAAADVFASLKNIIGGEVEEYSRLLQQTRDQAVERMKQDAICLLYTSPSPRDATLSRMPSSA